MPVDFNITGDYLKNGVPIGATNPTSGLIPYNNNGIFQDSGIEIIHNQNPFIRTKLIYRADLIFGGLSRIEINDDNGYYTFGDARVYNFQQSDVRNGIGFNTGFGECIIGSGISSPAYGVFRASGMNGVVSIGSSPDLSIGSYTFGLMLIGSSLHAMSPPTNPTLPVKWISVVDENFNQYYLPLYQ